MNKKFLLIMFLLFLGCSSLVEDTLYVRIGGLERRLALVEDELYRLTVFRSFVYSLDDRLIDLEVRIKEIWQWRVVFSERLDTLEAVLKRMRKL